MLPGSIHPDTGRLYKWAQGFDEAGANLPVLYSEAGKSGALAGEAVRGDTRPLDTAHAQFNFVPVDPESLGLVQTNSPRSRPAKVLKTARRIALGSQWLCFNGKFRRANHFPLDG